MATISLICALIFKAYILEMIEERQSSASEDRKDLLSNLIRATQEEEKTQAGGGGVCTHFTHQEVIGEPEQLV